MFIIFDVQEEITFTLILKESGLELLILFPHSSIVTLCVSTEQEVLHGNYASFGGTKTRTI